MSAPPCRAAIIGGFALIALAIFATPTPAAGRTLQVGPGTAFTQPSQAAAAARQGDLIQIAAGDYYDCAVWSAPALVIAGAGPATRLTDATCGGKAVMVITGRGITVRDLTLARARVPDGNGAGIRAEGPDLLLQRVRFEDNQDGLLAASQPDGVLRIEDCVFSGNGVAGSPRPTADLVVGDWAQLSVRATVFEREAGQSAILSDAALTRIEASHLAAATGPRAGATVQAAGGLVIEASTLAASGGPRGRRAAILALPPATAGPPGAALVVSHDTLQGGGTLLLNWSGRTPDLSDNSIGADGTESATAGAWSNRLRTGLHGAYDAARAAAGALRRHILHWLGR